MKRALITGVTGQDGAYLTKFLLDKGYEVYGTYRRASTPNFWRLQTLDVFDKVKLIATDLADTGSINEALKISEPEEVYNLAAQSFVGGSFEYPESTGNITGLGVIRILECIRQLNPSIKFYQASTSELYGPSINPNNSQNEETEFKPASPYGTAKLYAYWTTRVYRDAHNIFACNGILFNHESPLRGLEFVTRKISNAVARIKLGLQKELKIGNLLAKRDWGYAPDYVEAMWLMLQQEKPEDYVIATNETHSVKEFLEEAFSHAGLKWEDYVKVEEKLLRPLDVHFLKGDFSKARTKIGWEPKIKFNELVKMMVNADIQRWENWRKGESFSWDALNYPTEHELISRKYKLDRFG